MPAEDETPALRTVRRYFEALMRNDRATLGALLAPDIVHEELPNRLNPHGAIKDRAKMLAAFEVGLKLIAEQRFDVERSVVQGDTIALEVVWTGKLAAPVGSLKAGDTMKAKIAVFLDVREGRVVRQRNYDCFEEF